jgi:hypothetical protein
MTMRSNRSRALALLALALAAILALPTPARASSTAFDILASGTQTTTAQGGAIPVASIKELIVFVSCSGSSSPTQLDVYLQSSSDGGVTWYDLTADVIQQTNAAAAETAAAANKRDVLDAVTTCASPVKGIGRYTNFGSLVRAAWVLTGTNFSFSVKAIGKN